MDNSQYVQYVRRMVYIYIYIYIYIFFFFFWTEIQDVIVKIWLLKLYLVVPIYCGFLCLYNWNKWHLKKNTECSCYTRVIWDKYWLKSLEMIQRLRKKCGAFLSHLHTRDRGRTGSFSFVLHTICLHSNYCFILVICNPLDILNIVILNGNISGWVCFKFWRSSCCFMCVCVL